MVYLVKLAQSGNSVYLNLPKPLRRALRLHRGDQMLVSVVGNMITVRRAADVEELEKAGVPHGNGRRRESNGG